MLCKIHTTFVTTAILLIMSSGCSQNENEISHALKLAGDNAPELQEVLDHYAADDDSLKLRAAEFLIANMEDHCYVTYMFVDTAGEEVPFDALSFDNYDTLLASCAAIEKERGELDYKRKTRVDDIETITADFLIQQIDYAFRAWHEKPWAKDVSFEDFCEYILPYRGSNEPLESWREIFWDKYTGIDSSMSDPQSPTEAAALINRDVMTWFGFDQRYYFHPTDQGATEMLASGLGRCEDMTNVTIYAMRANGLAVTSDYTPHWANTGNNHAWNSILMPDGKVVPFMGAEANPGEYALSNKAAKVYRKTFSIRRENLVFQPNRQKEIPRWLGGKSYVDVTTDYVTTADPLVKFDEPVPDSVDIAYICVFNSGHWSAIDWARIENGAAAFTKMGTGIAYLPALYINEEIVPCGDPFILQEDGAMVKLTADTAQTQALSLKSTTRVKLNASTDGVAPTALTKGQEYELFCWMDGDWVSVGKTIASTKPLRFDTVPTSGLYWLVAADSDREERIFTIEDNNQIWW